MADNPPSPPQIPPIPEYHRIPPQTSHENQQVLFGVCKSFLAVIYRKKQMFTGEKPTPTNKNMRNNIQTVRNK